jgi:hypothetical protein
MTMAEGVEGGTGDDDDDGHHQGMHTTKGENHKGTS